jgi:hypothetical protein
MGKRGQKPIDVGGLNFWEFEFYKAFHLLRDGTSLPRQFATPSGLSHSEIQMFIDRLKRMTSADYYLTTQRVAMELGQQVNLKRPPTSMDLRWAENQRREELYWLERELNPPRIAAQGKRRKIWSDLVQANTYSALRKACGRWSQLPDVRRAGLTCFAEHVLTNVSQFLAMKQNKRFPKSGYADTARLEYLARGMAGVLSGRSPMTGIERLRNMKHDSGGPLWVSQRENYVLPENDQYCGCWRCRIETSNRAGKITRAGYDNGLRLLIELAKTTKAPKEWSRAKSDLNLF